MQRAPRRSLVAVLTVVAVLVGVAACGDSIVSPSPSAPATATPSATSTATTSLGPTATPRDTVRWSRLLFDEVSPESREMGSWTADSSGSVAYLFGGRGADGALGDLWAYDLAADRWLPLAPDGPAPAPRSGHVAAWIDGLGLVILGGRSDAGALDDMWIYDPEADGWRTQTWTGDAPAARWGSCSAVASDGWLWISHGTAGDATLLDDTWRYDPVQSSWGRLESGTGGPAARAGAACWWTDDDRFVLFGGQTADTAAVGDLWALPSAGGDWVGVESVAGTERVDAAVGRTAAAGVAFGGTSPSGTTLGDTVVVDARTLAMRLLDSTGDARPTARRGAVLVDDPGNERMLLFGGWDGSVLREDVWSLDLP